ncbi:lytic polysaccharide monooxygenase auxiliary activity family 9 protein [Streptomyces griseorubiginosus]|uniref:lytic polysaccharide monooxygenase auxiliary activity family 9 protein n=1 Tax=Streptomyces griseorubiginosus TaxID=67304 RepID=UPI001AD68F45|nr:lytic polysaccharide monooxygenase [Streptomyces griseorubiginosus]MBO4258630.1 chitin-binding protein [Streptomyces griseorubiginosus]
MVRMTAYRTALAAAVVTPFLLPLWAAGPAQAHGAPTDPVSRGYACSPDGRANARTAACKAAVAANGAPFTFWDDVRVSDVNGRDRQTIPDGKLCSGGLAEFKGLDLARSDWPSTRLKPGATLNMTYAAPIPHAGTFRLYLTKPGYDPTKPLTWSDLPAQPFASVKDPALTGGAYHFTAKLPANRTGRQVLFTIWQTSSTPDTYYSCSDVVFPGTESGGTAASASPSSDGGRTASGTPSPTAEKPRTPASPAQRTPTAAAESAAPSQPDSTPVAATETADSGPSAPMMAGGAAAVLVLTGGAALALRLRRR